MQKQKPRISSRQLIRRHGDPPEKHLDLVLESNSGKKCSEMIEGGKRKAG